MLAKAVDQPEHSALKDRFREQARSHIWISIHQIDNGLLWLLIWFVILILGAPLNHAGRREGTPSLGEVPSGGARALWLLWGFSKVTRRKGGTHISHHPNNGYILRLKRSSSHICIAFLQLEGGL